MGYQPQLVEKKWQKYWLENKTYKAEIIESKPKKYILDMFPYPSGEGLHVGHVEGYTASDIYSRFKRMQGFNVMHTIGWDAFGLPAEQYAIKTGQHPAITTANNIANFKKQMIAMGFSYDWDREISTAEPSYYKWTQQIFLTLYKKGLAYQDEALVNWCPALKAVLANEEVVDGLSEIGGHPVVRIPLKQWLLKITAYASRLEEDLKLLDWPQAIIDMQKNWIGKSLGANCIFKVDGQDESFEIFTTRPDTLFGATYCVLAPEHKLLKGLITKEQKDAVTDFLNQLKSLSDRERLNETNEKFGVFTGNYAINPVNGSRVPIWTANYVIGGYGTGAIMAVPAHDERDYEFAVKYQLPILSVIKSDKVPFTSEGEVINSDFINGLQSSAAKVKIVDYLEKNKLGKKTINYKLRDWIFTRQRYWGEPIPIIFDENNNTIPLELKDLPLVLPEVDKYQPTDDAQSPLSNATSWVNVNIDGKKYKRETNTMPQWAGSCWYYIRFCDPKNDTQLCAPKNEKYWLPVDLYVGGAEHAVLHLLYARFWHKVLYDEGIVSSLEPFKKLVNQGMILGEDGVKMSKSRGNVVNPAAIIESYGADTLRLYEMFLGPIEKSKPWQPGAIEGVYRFLNRVWNLIIDERTGKLNSRIVMQDPSLDELKLIHPVIAKLTADYENLKFNTAISALMIFLNDIPLDSKLSYFTVKTLIQLLNPLAPHITEELWRLIGEKDELSYAPWPVFDPRWLVKDEVTIAVQINGKTRVTVKAAAGSSQDDVFNLAKSESIVEKYLTTEIKKIIFVKDRIINIIV